MPPQLRITPSDQYLQNLYIFEDDTLHVCCPPGRARPLHFHKHPACFGLQSCDELCAPEGYEARIVLRRSPGVLEAWIGSRWVPCVDLFAVPVHYRRWLARQLRSAS